MKPSLFATAVIALFTLASIEKFWHGDWKLGLFYFFSAGINLVVIL